MIFIPAAKGERVVVYCSERGCGSSWTIPDEQVPDLLLSGEVVVRTTPQAGYSTQQTVGVCKACQTLYRMSARRRPAKRDADHEHRELMQLVARTREVHQDWSIERCVHESVEYVNSPELERDLAFRAYLLELEDN